MYKELKFEKILNTIAKLEERIRERFPDSGIGHVCSGLHDTAKGA